MTILRTYFPAWPILFIVVSIFWLRGSVGYVYMAAAVLVAITMAVQLSYKHDFRVTLGQWMAVLAAIGLSAAMILSIEKVELLSQPDHVASCSLSPIVACSPVIESWQASVFGLPNSFLGLIGYATVFAAAMTLLAGAQSLSRWWWTCLGVGLTFAVGFSGWLFYQGVFEIGKLCLYCMLVWLTSSALWWLVLPEVLKQWPQVSGRLVAVMDYRLSLIAGTYLVIFGLILYRWFEYWVSLI